MGKLLSNKCLVVNAAFLTNVCIRVGLHAPLWQLTVLPLAWPSYPPATNQITDRCRQCCRNRRPRGELIHFYSWSLALRSRPAWCGWHCPALSQHFNCLTPPVLHSLWLRVSPVSQRCLHLSCLFLTSLCWNACTIYSLSCFFFWFWNKVKSVENTHWTKFISYLWGQRLMQQGPQLRVLLLQALRFIEELTDIWECHAGNTGNRRLDRRLASPLCVWTVSVCTHWYCVSSFIAVSQNLSLSSENALLILPQAWSSEASLWE